MASVEDAGVSDWVTVTCTDDPATLTSDTFPDHELMTGIVSTNEQILVIVEYGAPIYDYSAGGEVREAELARHQVLHDTPQTGQLDVCGRHAGRGDDYHYHVAPTCIIDAMDNAGEDGAIIGWAFDGFPIYGENNPDGTVIAKGVLDVCNGRPDDQFGYRYHTSRDSPYIVQCLMGMIADLERLPRLRPMSATAGGGSEPGRPPQGGVDDLVMTRNADGSTSMDYRHQGQDYYIRYAPTGTEDCYDYTTSTVTDGGEVLEGEFCQ